MINETTSSEPPGTDTKGPLDEAALRGQPPIEKDPARRTALEKPESGRRKVVEPKKRPVQAKKIRRFQRDMSALLQDYRFEVGRPDEGERLDSFLSQRVRWRSRAQVQSLIREGRVEISEIKACAGADESHGSSTERANEASTRPAFRLRAGQEIILWLDGPGAADRDATVTDAPLADAGKPTRKRRGSRATAEPTTVTTTCAKVRGVYEDAYLLAVDKPAGMTVYPTRRHRKGSLIEIVHRRHQQMSGSGSPPSPCHRLDRETSGVLLFARDVETRAAIGEQIERRHIRKSYLAVVEGTPQGTDGEEQGTIDLALGQDPSSRVKLRQAAVESGQSAVTHWRVVQRLANHSLVELCPETGRQHQLRAHLCAIGHPIVGDKLYLGGDQVFLRSMADGLTADDWQRLGHERQALHAWKLELTHPATRDPLEIEAPLPPDLVALVERLAG